MFASNTKARLLITNFAEVIRHLELTCWDITWVDAEKLIRRQKSQYNQACDPSPAFWDW